MYPEIVLNNESSLSRSNFVEIPFNQTYYISSPLMLIKDQIKVTFILNSILGSIFEYI
jgi:hypothetical protein